MGTLLHSCAIELPFGAVSRVGPGIGVLDGVHVLEGEGEVLGEFWRVFPLALMGFLSFFLKRECI